MKTPLFFLLSALFIFSGVGSLLHANTIPDANPVPDGVGLELWAEVDEAAPSITLRFYVAEDFAIYRRDYGGTTWVQMTASTGSGTASWTDDSVVPGKAYEYAAVRGPSGLHSRHGYAAAGIRLDRAEHRGTLILVLAENIVEYNAERIGQLYADLIGDGWKVETIYAPTFNRTAFAGRDRFIRRATKGLFGHRYPEIIRNRIRAIYDADPDGVKQVYFLGHTPIALTGTSVDHVDGHGSRATYVSDHYFVDIDGVWTDEAVNSPTGNISGGVFGGANLPGDGIWDQSQLPSTVDIGFGRVDPWDKGGAQWLGLTEPELVDRYLDKAHKYRHNLPFGFPGEEMRAGTFAMVRGPAGQSGASHTSGQFLNIVGPQNMPHDFIQNHRVPEAVPPNTNPDVQITRDKGPFLFWGQSTQGPNTANDKYRRSVFNHGMQSYWGDWQDREGMRQTTMDEGMVLSWIYTGRFSGQIFYYPMGIGEPLGTVMRLSSTYEENEILEGRDPNLPGSSTEREMMRALLADPALRAFVVPPVRDLEAVVSDGSVALSWTEPEEMVDFVEYRVRRANDIRGDFELIASGLSAPTFTDVDAPEGSKAYMVQAVFLREGGSGTLLSNSQGKFAFVGLKMETPVLPPFPVGEDADFSFAASQAEGPLAWTIISGELPDGMTMSPEGRLTGNPIVPGEYPVRVSVSDGSGSLVERDFVLFVDASFTEVIDLDLRAVGGLGLRDRAMPSRPFTLLGDAGLDAETGMYFDGDGDALRLHDLGQISQGEWEGFSHTAGDVDHFSVSFSFKADPDSTGGTLVSKADGPTENHFTVRMDADGRVEAWQQGRTPLASAPGNNDGEWHSVTFTADPADGKVKLYLDGLFIAEQDRGEKNPVVDLLVGARWADADAALITDEFEGWIADLRYTSAEVSAGEARAIYERLVRTRPEINPSAPTISGLPETLDNYPGRTKLFPFEVQDVEGQPIRPYVTHDNPDAIEHIEIVATASGYAVKVIATEERGETADVTLWADNGYPGLTAETTLTYRQIGPQHDNLRASAHGWTDLDVRANDIYALGRTHVLDGIVSHPVYADDPDGPLVGGVEIVDGKVRFHPPTLWGKPIRFTYRLRDPLTGETETAEVIVRPVDQPLALDDEFVLRGDASGLLDVAANDSDPLGGALEIVAMTQPDSGRVEIEGDQVRYFPQIGGGSGTTQFSYTVRNAIGSAATASVSVLYGNAGGDPLVRFEMEEGSGSSLQNVGQLGGTDFGSLVGGTPEWVTGPDGLALAFVGHDGVIDLGNSPAMRFNPAHDSFSISVAVETSLFSGANYPMTLISKGRSDSGNAQLVIAFEDDSVVVRVGDERIVANQVSPSAAFGEWLSTMPSSHFQWWNTEAGMERWRVFTVINDAEQKRLKMYVSQFLVAEVDTSELNFDVAENGANWIVGGEPNGGGYSRHLKGAIDNLRIYDWAIRPEEIRLPFREMNFRVKQLQPDVFNLHPAAGYELEIGKTYRFTVDSRIGEPDESEGEFAISTGTIYRVGDHPVEMRASINRSPGHFVMSLLEGPSRGEELVVTPDRLGRFEIAAVVRAVRDPNDPEASSFTNWGISRASYTVIQLAPPIPDRIAIESAADLGTLALRQPIAIDLLSSGGEPPRTWDLTSGLLPPGLTLDSSSGALSGTPELEGSFTFGVRVTEGKGNFAERAFTLGVAPADLDGNHLPDDWESETLGETGVDAFDPGTEDGVPHLLRFALGVDLTEGMRGMGMRQQVVGPFIEGNNRYLALDFWRRREVGNLNVLLQSSDDLSSWHSIHPVRETVLEDDGKLQRVEVLIPEPTEDQNFYRIRVNPSGE